MKQTIYNTTRALRVEHFKQHALPYGPMLGLQQQRMREVLKSSQDDTLFVLEHTPVITCGRNTIASHILYTKEQLQQQGVDYCETGRGGDVTFHGPGQLVVYPVIKLMPAQQDIKQYVFCLEEIIIRTAADIGVRAHRIDGLRGVWVGRNKLAAIGVRVANWVTMHGFALNIDIDTNHFKMIIPCGLHDYGITSIAKEVAGHVDKEAVYNSMLRHTADILQRHTYHAELSQLATSWHIECMPLGGANEQPCTVG